MLYKICSETFNFRNTRHCQNAQSNKCSNHERPVFASAVGTKTIVWKIASVSSCIYQTDHQKLLRRFPNGKRPILVRYRGASLRLSFHCCNYGICNGGRRYCLWGTSTITEDTLHVSRKCRCNIAQLPVHQY
jgi:hypothetical protein